MIFSFLQMPHLVTPCHPVFVVIGNPPYNAGQVNENDNNKNRKYPRRVRETYAKDSRATLTNSLYDPYVKAFLGPLIGLVKRA